MLNKDDIDLCSFTNLRMQRRKPTGIFIELHSLGNEDALIDIVRRGKEWSKKNILFIYPYTSPWNWMNSETVEFVDELLEIIFDINPDFRELPIAVSGYSMGGYGALIYPVFSRHKISACAAVCPICDMSYHFTENTYVSRTMISAFFSEPDLNRALTERSPMHITEKMPKIPYLLLHCMEDEKVNIAKHSDELVSKLKDNGFDVIYHTIEKGGHCRLDANSKALIEDFITEHLT